MWIKREPDTQDNRRMIPPVTCTGLSRAVDTLNAGSRDSLKKAGTSLASLILRQNSDLSMNPVCFCFHFYMIKVC